MRSWKVNERRGAETQRETQREIPALVQSKLNFILVASFPALLP
ncbi:MAG: hypothetical protein JWP03_400, partial [Phycisphaerales bacterium]|nr:hypothetical protein [Phycisphaerales bacterium]